MKIVLTILSLSFLHLACGFHQKSDLELALELAGQNRSELQKVLECYNRHPADSLKYKAACFLIENMSYHYSLKKEDNSSGYKIIRDIEIIRSEFLINHIENVFATKNYPWERKLAFPDFCEYILPYRVFHEPIEEWRMHYEKQLRAFMDSTLILQLTDSALCAQYVSKFVYPLIKSETYENMTPVELLNMERGTCRDFALLGRFIMSYLNIPIAWDFTPSWGTRSGRHDWNVLLLESGKQIPFLCGDNCKFGDHLASRTDAKFAKVFRKTYSIQKENLIMQDIKEAIPLSFIDPYYKDVSELYFDAVNIAVSLTIPPPEKKEIVYIMIFDNKKWTPIHWTRIGKEKVVFDKMAKGIMYIAMYYHEGRFYPASDPFMYDITGKLRYYRHNESFLDRVILHRKYPHRKLSFFYAQRMRYGEFQGSNDCFFKKPEIFWRIEKTPDVTYHTIATNNQKSFRYVRYLSRRNSYGNVAEVEFYASVNDSLQKLSGKIIGTGNLSGDDPKKGKETVFDGDPLTFFDSSQSDFSWVGLDMGKPYKIEKIRFLPRNDGNLIEVGDEYELVYWSEGKWNSLGRQVAAENFLIYENIPADVLFILHNHTKGIEERIFTIENGEQIWW